MSVVQIPERAPARTPPASTPPAPTKRTDPGRRSASAWRWTAGTGLALVVLAAVHIVAQHFVVNQVGGLRTYRQVLDFISTPIISVLECGFLFAVTIHAMLGLRSVLLDLDLRPRIKRRLDTVLWIVGTLTVAYGLVLLITLATRA